MSLSQEYDSMTKAPEVFGLVFLEMFYSRAYCSMLDMSSNFK